MRSKTEDPLQLFMERKGNLWRYVDEALAQQQTHRFACVAEDLLELFCYAVRSVLLTLAHYQLLDILHTLHTLQKKIYNNNNYPLHLKISNHF